MNRRTFWRAGLGVTVTAAVGTNDMIAAQSTPVQATPGNPGQWIRIARDYTDRRTGQMRLYAVLTYIPDAKERTDYFQSTKDEALESDSQIYLTHEVEDAPEFGDASFVATGKLNVDEYVGMFGVKEGNLVYFFAFRGVTARTALAAGYAFLPDFFERLVTRERYTDEELFALMPTEHETGFEVAWEGYDTGESAP